MNKAGQVFLSIIISLLCLVLPAAGVGLIGFLTRVGFWVPFLATAVIMAFLGYLSNLIIADRHSKRMYLVGIDQAAAVANQKMWTECAYCKKPMSIFTSTRNGEVVDCSACGMANRLAITINTIQITEPIDSEPLTMKDLEEHGMDPQHANNPAESRTI
jgi:hypothetical protein